MVLAWVLTTQVREEWRQAVENGADPNTVGKTAARAAVMFEGQEVSAVPGPMWEGLGPVPGPMWHGASAIPVQSPCRSPRADVRQG